MPEHEDDIVFVDHRLLFSGLLNSIIVLSTFGIVCPLLAFAMTALIVVQTYQLQVTIGRFVAIEAAVSTSSTAQGERASNIITMDMEMLERQCAKAPLRPLLDASKYIIFISSFLLSLFLYDIVADRNGAVPSLPSLLIINVFVGLFVFVYPFVLPWVRKALAARPSVQCSSDTNLSQQMQTQMQMQMQMQEPFAAEVEKERGSE